MKQLVSSLNKRLNNIDYVKFFSNDLIVKLNLHFKQVIQFKNSNESAFKLNSFESSREKEEEYLRKLAELFILQTFSEKNYFRNAALRYLLREILAVKSIKDIKLFLSFYLKIYLVLIFKVLLPSIDMMSDPDYLNQKLLSFLTNKEKQRSKLQYSNLFSNDSITYDELIKIVKSSSKNGQEQLSQVRDEITKEIMKLTIKSNYIDSENNTHMKNMSSNNSTSSSSLNNALIRSGHASFYAFFSDIKTIDQPNMAITNPQGQNFAKMPKSELLRSNYQALYINMLRNAKKFCDKKLRSRMGSEDDETSDLSIKEKLNNLIVSKSILLI